MVKKTFSPIPFFSSSLSSQFLLLGWFESSCACTLGWASSVVVAVVVVAVVVILRPPLLQETRKDYFYCYSLFSFFSSPFFLSLAHCYSGKSKAKQISLRCNSSSLVDLARM